MAGGRTIAVDGRVALSELRGGDCEALVRYLNDREIYDRTLRIPCPYGREDAERFLNLCGKLSEQHGHPLHFAIRDREQQLIGGCGFDGLVYGHRAEIGYWLGKPYWGQGLMTEVVRAATAFAFREWKLVRISAHVFTTNPASARVLEKCGFQHEGLLRLHHKKDDRFLDSQLFAKVAPPDSCVPRSGTPLTTGNV